VNQPQLRTIIDIRDGSNPRIVATLICSHPAIDLDQIEDVAED